MIRKVKKSLLLYAVLFALIVLLNIIAWNSTAFCDAYIAWVFPIWVNTYGRFMNLFPFSVGEIMLYLAVVLVIVFLVTIIVYGCMKLLKKRENIFLRGYMKFVAWTVLIVCLIMTLNCSILYHASTFSEKYFGKDPGEYTIEDLISVRNYVVERCESLADQMKRDDSGRIVYTGNIHQDAVESMQKLGETYDQLDGYYPYPKPLATSDFFSQQYMCGYYFPFSMEANYNDVMYIMNLHATMCHELAHLRGYIYEDEANFISYLACVGSDDPMVQYSGYLSVLNYLDNDFYKAVGRDWEQYSLQPAISQQVRDDNMFLTPEEWERIERKAMIETETVDEVSDVLTDTVLKANGVSDGMISYNRVVRLLLQYYKQVGLP